VDKLKKISSLNYAFAIGKIRVLERFLIKQEVFEEAIESNLGEALKIFVESDLYTDELLYIKDSQGLEQALGKELGKLKGLIQDLLLDKRLLGLMQPDTLEQMQKIASSYPSQFLKDYVLHLTDMHNIKSFLRLYILKEPLAKLKEVLVSSGFIPKEDFLRLYTQDLTLFLKRLEYVHKDAEIIDYADFLREAIQKVEKEHSFVALEKVINDFLIQVLKPAKYISFGPEPLLAYYFAKVNEMNLMRMIILAKLNNLLADTIKERLNLVYA
jgi:V/A-type H+-transporting ATPase subunit C